MVARPDMFDEVHAATSETLEILQAERDLAILYTRRLVNMIERVGGFMYPGDQEGLRDAKAFLVEIGGVG